MVRLRKQVWMLMLQLLVLMVQRTLGCRGHVWWEGSTAGKVWGGLLGAESELWDGAGVGRLLLLLLVKRVRRGATASAGRGWLRF